MRLVAASGGHSSSRCAGLSLSRPLLLRSTGSRHAGSVTVAHGRNRSAACGIFPDQGSNPCALHWQADSQPLHHQGSPIHALLKSNLNSTLTYRKLWSVFYHYIFLFRMWYKYNCFSMYLFHSAFLYLVYSECDIHPWCWVCQKYVSSCYWLLFHFTDASQFVYLFTIWWIFRPFPVLGSLNKTTIKIHI